MAGEKIRALTGLRGVAALWVVWHHLGREPGFAVPFGQALPLRGYLAVDLFFVLSGFVLSLAFTGWFITGASWRGAGAFVARRLARIWPMHAAAVLALLAACSVVGVAWPPASSVAANLALAQGWGWGASINPSSWSLSAEFAAYLLFPILVPVVHRGPWSAWVTVAAASVLLAAAVHLASPDIMRYGPLDVPDDRNVAPVLRCLGGFLVGMAAYRLSRASRVAAWLARPGAAEATLGGLLGAVVAGVPDLALYPLLPLLVASLAASRGLAARTLASGVFHRLGVISFAVYLVHFPIIQVGIAGAAPSFGLAASLLAVVLCVACLAHVLVERPGRWLGLSLAARIGAGPSPIRDHRGDSPSGAAT